MANKYFNKKAFLKACNQVAKNQDKALDAMVMMEATANEVATNIEVANKELKDEIRRAHEAMYASL